MAIITEQSSDIFSAPPKSILIHACNARGAWGSGVALTFKQKHPSAFRAYNAHCRSPPAGSKLSVKQHQASIVGTTLLIPPLKATVQQRATQTPHYIACLFTSLDYGKRVSPAEEILVNTGKALEDLARQVAEMRGLGEEVGTCYAVRINSGKFGVGWQKTKAVLEAGDLDITVARPEKADGAGAAAEEELGQLSTTRGKANGSKPFKLPGAKVESPDHRQMIGEKRKLEADTGGDGNGDRENADQRQPAPLHPGIAKRRKKLGLDK